MPIIQTSEPRDSPGQIRNISKEKGKWIGTIPKTDAFSFPKRVSDANTLNVKTVKYARQKTYVKNTKAILVIIIIKGEKNYEIERSTAYALISVVRTDLTTKAFSDITA